MPDRPRFHLAFSVSNLDEARAFYGGLLGCAEGRASDSWIDFDFHGHQIVAHLAPRSAPSSANPVDGDVVPVPHFGLILGWQAWEALARSLTDANVEFLIPPRVRFAGSAGEQATFFMRDPFGNALEFKAFRDPDRIFARV